MFRSLFIKRNKAFGGVAELEASVHYIIDASPVKQRGQDIEDILSETFSQQEEEMLAESPDMSPADAAVASPF